MNNLKKLNRGGKSIGLLLFLFLMLGNIGAWAQNTVSDILTANLFKATENKYIEFSNVSVTSDAIYAGSTAKNSAGAIQLNSSDPNGIVTTTSGGKLRKVIVTWNSSTSNGRTLDIYGKSTAYTTAKDLHSTSTQGTKLGSIIKGTSTELEITGDYEYIGLRSSKSAMYLTSIELVYEVTPSGPAINADDVTYAADITKGEISYTISNASGSTMTAKSSTTWIKNVDLTDPQKVTFDMEENTATEPREGVIELTYGTLTKEVKVTQLAAVAKRTVTIEEPENGTLQILRDGEEVVSGSQVPEGTVLTAVVTPNEGYKFRNWQAVDFVNDEKTTHTYDKNFTYTVGGSDVTFKANFDPIVYTTITWSVNGVTTTEKVEQGTDIAFTAPTTIPEGYVFTGWYGDKYTNNTTAPKYVTSATATNDVTYYAVFAKSTGGGSEQTLELTNARIQQARSEASSTSGYQDNQDIDGWTGKFLYLKNKETYALQTNYETNNGKSAYNSHLTTPKVSAPIKSITINTNNNTVSGRTVYLCASNSVGAAIADDAVYGSGSTEESNGSITIDVKNNPTQLSIYANGLLYIASVTLTYGEPPVLSDFRTSVPTPTATISISSACTDGSLCYGTFSSTKPFVVPGDVKVSEINITEEGELLVESYAPGAVVPANTGVMVSALTGDNYEVELTDEAGTSVLGDRNMLRPTGAGITADQMATADPNCLYYRLTMHQGETLGFFWGAADGAAFNVAAGKAYLAVPVTQAARVNGFVLGGGTSTGIDSIADSMAAQRTVYNLQGQRVSGRLAKGVYIVNGKKVIIK